MSKHLVLSVLSEVSKLSEVITVKPETAQLTNDFIQQVLTNEVIVGDKVVQSNSKKTQSTKKKVSEPDAEVPEEESTKPDTKPEKKAEDPEKESKPKKSLLDLVKELPEGDGTFVEPPFSYFEKLPKAVAQRYLSGVKISAMTNAKLLAEASKTGVNKDFAELVLEAHSAPQHEVEKPIKLDEGSKAQQLVEKLAPKIEFGQDLFDLMSRNGADGQTMKDYSKIVKLIATGK